MDLAIGTKFTFNGKTYIVTKDNQACWNCDLNKGMCLAARHRDITGYCNMIARKDKKNIIFKEVKDMNNEINIAEILKDKPEGTKLLSSAFGSGTLDSVDYDIPFPIAIRYPDTLRFFSKEGKYTNAKDSECVLFPSKEMHDWSKFAWKKGDILTCIEGRGIVIFREFTDETYTTFSGKHYLVDDDSANIVYTEEWNNLNTQSYFLANKDTAQCYVKIIEKRLGGRLDPDTLNIVPLKPMEHAKPKWTPKPFDKVLVRDKDTEVWKPAFFSHYQSNIIDEFAVIASECDAYLMCIPYNENTAKLIGTTNDYKEGCKE